MEAPNSRHSPTVWAWSPAQNDAKVFGIPGILETLLTVQIRIAA
jgi:hypothetical protein